MNKFLFIEYPKCSTCQKAKRWLEEKHISFEDRHIIEETPTVEELRQWHQRSRQELKKFFNTSGLKYKALNLKEKLPLLSTEEQFALLASDGMLIKRPLLIGDDFVLTGFQPLLWEKAITSSVK